MVKMLTESADVRTCAQLFWTAPRMTDGLVKISVLLAPREAARFSAYCDHKGYKKSSLIARLVREHLDGERFDLQPLSAHAARQKNPRKR